MSRKQYLETKLKVLEPNFAQILTRHHPIRLFKYRWVKNHWVMGIVDGRDILEIDLALNKKTIIECLIDDYVNGPEAKDNIEKIKTDVEEVAGLVKYFCWQGQNLSILEALNEMGPPTTKDALEKIIKNVMDIPMPELCMKVNDLFPDQLQELLKALRDFEANNREVEK